MKKLWIIASVVIAAFAFLLTGCGGEQKTSTGKTVLTVGATPVPHAEILEQVKPILAKEGIDLQIKEFTDYNTPNKALADKELDANFFQHVPYLEEFAKAHKLDLVSAGKVHVEPIGIYSKANKDLKNIKDGAKIAIPNDATNGGRALIFLDKLGIIKLKDNKDITSTVQDIVSNPHHIQFVEVEAATVPRTLDDVDYAVINTNYALQANLNPGKDALALEDKDSPYVNIVAVRKGDENRPEIKKLIEALHSQEIKDFILKKYNGAVQPAF